MPSIIATCSPMTLIEAALSFTGNRQVFPKELTERKLIFLGCCEGSGQRIPCKRRRLLSPSSLIELSDGWQQVERFDGKYGIRPSPDIAIEWISLTKSRLLAVPFPERTFNNGRIVSSYLLRLISRQGQGSRYCGVLRDLGVEWKDGSLLLLPCACMAAT
jgi:hypothetical protein